MLTNALKYAFPTGQGKIEIALMDWGSEFILSVADNGIGVPSHIDLQNTDSLGMQLIHSLTEQLQGEFRYSYRAGSHFQLTFPRYP